VQAEIDEKLLSEIRRLARQQGRPERELLDEAIRRYLERADPRRFEELLTWMSSRSELGEEEAMELAYEELHAMRRERRAAR
jgi:metal-responsive CopG/Arc/MetJ family transcriptional regulator